MPRMKSTLEKEKKDVKTIFCFHLSQWEGKKVTGEELPQADTSSFLANQRVHAKCWLFFFFFDKNHYHKCSELCQIDTAIFGFFYICCCNYPTTLPCICILIYFVSCLHVAVGLHARDPTHSKWAQQPSILTSYTWQTGAVSPPLCVQTPRSDKAL